MVYELEKADTVSVIYEWKETLAIKRPTVTYNGSGIPTETLTTVGTFLGDWQPASGNTIFDEAGIKINVNAKIIAPVDAGVDENDIVYRSDGTFMHVRHIFVFEDHLTIYLTDTKEA